MTRLATVALCAGMGITVLAAGPVQAAQCMKAGGWGANILPGVAEFMAEAALKNSAKARLGTDSPKIGPVSQKCEQKGLMTECVASAKACK
jgi:hypothetical protein